ncbi:MAG: major capsid protein [Solirubrobacteraceae bacterium]
MAVTLAQSALLSQDQLQRGVLEIFVQEGILLDRLPLMPVIGNSYAYNSEATLPGVEFRAVNGAYAESTGTVVQAFEKLVILGGDADVDTFVAKTKGNLNDQRGLQDKLKVKALNYKFQDGFINGDVATDANSFDGLKKRLVGAQVVAAGANGLPVVGNGASDVQAFLDFLDQLIASVPGISAGNGALYMNTMIRTKVLSALRRANVNVESVGRLPAPLRTSVSASSPVNQADLPTYNSIPMLDIGARPDGTLIIPQTETQGTAVDCSSIYAVKFGSSEADQAVTGLSNGGVDVRDLGEQQVKPAFRTRIEFFCGVAVFGGKAAARGIGVRNL